MCRLLGRHEDDLVGRDVADVTHPDDMPHERRWVAAWLARGAEQVFQYEKRFVTGSGEIIWTSVHVSLIAGEPDGRFFLVHALDITDRKRAQQSALGGSVDPLTGLLIEPAFLRELQARRLAEDLPLAVVRLKLLSADDVQAVHGYAARDELVERGARRLNAALPPDARLARVGADEFAAFFKATGRESLQVTKEALARIAAEPPAATRTAAHIAFVAGVAACDPGQHDRAEAIYTSAGIALEDALRGGTGAALSGRAARERAAKRLSWQTRLRRGLDEAGFLVHGQPVARLDTGAVEFTELSLRMHDEDGKLVFPAVFLPVAESTGMITAIDRWLLRRVRDLLVERPDERFAIRLSAATLGDRAARGRRRRPAAPRPRRRRAPDHRDRRRGEPAAAAPHGAPPRPVRLPPAAPELRDGVRLAVPRAEPAGVGGQDPRQLHARHRGGRARPRAHPRRDGVGRRARRHDDRRVRREPGDGGPAARARRRLRPGLPLRAPRARVGPSDRPNGSASPSDRAPRGGRQARRRARCPPCPARRRQGRRSPWPQAAARPCPT